MVQWLVTKQQADVQSSDPGGWTHLHVAAQEGNLDGVQFFVRGGTATLAQVTNQGCAPLHIAYQESKNN